MILVCDDTVLWGQNQHPAERSLPTHVAHTMELRGGVAAQGRRGVMFRLPHKVRIHSNVMAAVHAQCNKAVPNDERQDDEARMGKLSRQGQGKMEDDGVQGGRADNACINPKLPLVFDRPTILSGDVAVGRYSKQGYVDKALFDDATNDYSNPQLARKLNSNMRRTPVVVAALPFDKSKTYSQLRTVFCTMMNYVLRRQTQCAVLVATEQRGVFVLRTRHHNSREAGWDAAFEAFPYRKAVTHICKRGAAKCTSPEVCARWAAADKAIGLALKRSLGELCPQGNDENLRACNTVMNDEELIKFVMNINRALHHHLGFAQARAADRLHRVPIYLQWCRLDADFTQPVNVEIRVVDDNRVRCFRQAREGGEGTTYTIQLPATPGHPGHMEDAYDVHVHRAYVGLDDSLVLHAHAQDPRRPPVVAKALEDNPDNDAAVVPRHVAVAPQVPVDDPFANLINGGPWLTQEEMAAANAANAANPVNAAAAEAAMAVVDPALLAAFRADGGLDQHGVVNPHAIYSTPAAAPSGPVQSARRSVTATSDNQNHTGRLSAQQAAALDSVDLNNVLIPMVDADGASVASTDSSGSDNSTNALLRMSRVVPAQNAHPNVFDGSDDPQDSADDRSLLGDGSDVDSVAGDGDGPSADNSTRDILAALGDRGLDYGGEDGFNEMLEHFEGGAIASSHRHLRRGEAASTLPMLGGGFAMLSLSRCGARRRRSQVNRPPSTRRRSRSPSVIVL